MALDADALQNITPYDNLLFRMQMLMQGIVRGDVRLSLVLCWIPAHEGAYGNELADAYAKEAVDKQTAESLFPALREAKSTLKTMLKEKKNMYWLASEKGTTTRKFFDTFT